MARCSGCHKRFKKGEVWPWTDQVLWPWTDQVFKYEFCKPCHPKGGYAAEIRIGDVVEYFSTREDTERQWVGKVEDKLPRGISSCKLPMLKIAGKPGYVLESHCQIRKEESPAPTPVMDFVPADLLEAEAMKNSEHFEGPQDYLICWDKGSNNLYVEFKVYAIEGVVSFPNKGALMLPKKGGMSSTDTTYEPDEAQVFLEGSVKWDGCANLYFPDDCYHFCGGKDAFALGDLMRRLWEITRENVKEYDGDSTF